MKKYSKIIAPVLLLALIFGGCAIYVNDYYPVDGEALLECLPDGGDGQFYFRDDGSIIAKPENPIAGFIFYPGGKVEHSSYLPLALELAKRDILTVICPMPLRLAVLDVNAADGIKESFPDVTDWYIGGHSLGGSMAASYLEKHPELAGLILLGSYSTSDVSDSRVLSVYGSMDGVMNREKYEKYKTNLPEDFTEVVISGGNHAYFGCYGEQGGDGKSEISNAEQIAATADIILDFIK